MAHIEPITTGIIAPPHYIMVPVEPPPTPPTENDLPYEDGLPMETQWHALQIQLLVETLSLYWAGRDDVAVHGNMFVYFSENQVLTHDYRGPDFFAAQGVEKRMRKSWLTWREGKAPDVVIELLSESTAEKDKNEKKLIYQTRLRVPEYFWYDPRDGEWAGFRLHGGQYESLTADAQGRLISRELQLLLTHWEGSYMEESATWLRWMTLTGELLPTGRERAEEQRQSAEQQRQRADAAEQRAQELEAQLAQCRAQFGEIPKESK